MRLARAGRCTETGGATLEGQSEFAAYTQPDEEPPRLSRWRLGFAISLTIVAIPLWLQAGEPGASADVDRVDAPGDPDARGYALLANRATAWNDLRTVVVDEQEQEALAAAAAAAAATSTTTTLAPPTTRLATTTRPPTTVATTKPPTTRPPTTVTTTRAPTTTRPPTTTAKPTTTAPAPTAPPTTAVPAPPPGPPRALPAGTTAEMWLQLRMCESGNNYRAISSGGVYRGAYQFTQGTWNSVASSTPSLARLVGVDPATAAPVDQDSMGYTLYELRGKSPWPNCGAPLP